MKKSAFLYTLEIISIFPISFNFWIAWILGLVAIHTPNSISRYTDTNIQLCLRNLRPSQQQYLASASIRHTCYSLFELTAVWCWPADKTLTRVTSDIFIGAMYRNEDTATFKPSISALDHAKLTTTETDGAQYLNDQIELMVASLSAQYQRSYRRFSHGVYNPS